MSSQVETPPELAGATFDGTLRRRAGELKQELIRQTLADVESWVKAMQREYELAHPDRPDDTVIPDGSGWVRRVGPTASHEQIIPEAELERYRNAVRNEYYEWVVPAFERYLQPDPDAVNPMIGALRQIESMFGGSQDNSRELTASDPALKRIGDVRSEMSHWVGDFQINFIDNFLTPLENTPGNCAAAAKMAREVLELNKVAYIAQRKAVLDLIDTSMDALKELAATKSPDAHTWATLIGIAAGTVLTGFTVTAWIGITLISASTLAQGLTPDEKTKSNLSAPTAQEVAVKISEALAKVSEKVREDEETVLRLFQTLAEGIANSRAKVGELKVPRPSIVSAGAGDVTSGGLRPSR